MTGKQNKNKEVLNLNPIIVDRYHCIVVGEKSGLCFNDFNTLSSFIFVYFDSAEKIIYDLYFLKNKNVNNRLSTFKGKFMENFLLNFLTLGRVYTVSSCMMDDGASNMQGYILIQGVQAHNSYKLSNIQKCYSYIVQLIFSIWLFQVQPNLIVLFFFQYTKRSDVLEEMVEKIEFELTVKRLCKRQTNSANPSTDKNVTLDIENYCRITIFLPCLEYFLNELQ
ncbi:hypothetical protein AGLY_007992 [Aphis glycines]|uniref:Uncharacterized protein n=1 Tax=Aphis glycines TaxID=307491 RepID=A0A6G0TMG3_APHGL|nr:hypothetical protein AGLY_007992 [Aphis glycines]